MSTILPTTVVARDDQNNNEDSSAAAMHQRQQQQSDSLRVENERLKRELFDLRRRMNQIEQQQDYPNYRVVPLPAIPSSPEPQQRPDPKNINNAPIVLELPEILNNNNKSSKNSNNNRHRTASSSTPKDHQSVSTNDDRETVEPEQDIEAHQSAGGLHHRSPFYSKTTRTISTISTTKTPRTEPMSDDEISSSEDEDPLAEARGLIGSKPRSNENEILRAVESTSTTEEQQDNNNDPSQRSFCKNLSDRAGWLVGLLVFQSLSSFILARNESLLQKHTVVVHFLTMLVGAGGNAGNQASVGVVRGIAIGSVSRANARRVLCREFLMGAALSVILGMAGLVRSKAFGVPWWETIAITTSLYLIVIISVILGASLPMGMEYVGIDPAHSSTTIQVIMDITGVVITVHVSSLLLDSEFRDWLDTKFSG